MVRHFTQIRDLDNATLLQRIQRAKEMKDTALRSQLLAGKTVVMLFEKASTRTRLSFEVAVHQLGGKAIFMTANECQLGRSEPLRDMVRVVSRYNDGMIVRTFAHETLDELIKYGTVPVINALTDKGHPCQIMADLLTIYERTPDFSALRVAWVGDGNNMVYSWIEACMCLGFELAVACPKGYEPDSGLVAVAKAAGAKLTITHDPVVAVTGAHYINTDVWSSMGQEHEQAIRERAFAGFCVDAALMAKAAPSAKFMHCLPAHRGEEVTEAVLEGAASIVFDQAENRLHAQKSILEWVFSG